MMTSEAPHALAVNRHTRPMGPGGGGKEGGFEKWGEAVLLKYIMIM